MVLLAQDEARTLRHDYIRTEHILLGLLRDPEGLAGRVLESLEITVEPVRAQVVRIVGSRDEVTSGQIPFTPRAKNLLERAPIEALSLGQSYIGTESVLLALVRESEGVAARILLDFDADAEKLRNEILRTLTGPGAPDMDRSAEATAVVWGSRAGAGDVDRPAEATVAWGPRVDASRWDVLVDGAATPLQILVGEIEQRLARLADAGDLLVVLASIPDGVGQRALEALGVHADELLRAVDEARSGGPP